MYIKVNGVERFNTPARAPLQAVNVQCPDSLFKASRRGRKR
jgi:hypothetical protein